MVIMCANCWDVKMELTTRCPGCVAEYHMNDKQCRAKGGRGSFWSENVDIQKKLTWYRDPWCSKCLTTKGSVVVLLCTHLLFLYDATSSLFMIMKIGECVTPLS